MGNYNTLKKVFSRARIWRLISSWILKRNFYLLMIDVLKNLGKFDHAKINGCLFNQALYIETKIIFKGINPIKLFQWFNDLMIDISRLIAMNSYHTIGAHFKERVSLFMTLGF